MTFSPEWDREFREGKHLSRYPWSDLVSFVNRYANLKLGDKVLELGCGAGANIPLFHGYDYYGIEGSHFMAHSAYFDGAIRRGQSVNVYCADFTKEIPFGDTKFDLIFDRAAVAHNDTEGVKRCIELVRGRLKSGGKYIGIDWFSTYHSWCGALYHRNKRVDELTFTDYVDGPFKGTGKVHFSSYDHLMDLFNGFQFEALEHKVIQRYLPEHKFLATWNFCCTLK